MIDKLLANSSIEEQPIDPHYFQKFIDSIQHIFDDYTN